MRRVGSGVPKSMCSRSMAFGGVDRGASTFPQPFHETANVEP